MKKSMSVLSTVLLLVCSSYLVNAQKKGEEQKGKQNPDGSYSLVDQTAIPPNGLESLYGYVSKNMKYPKQARKLGVEGSVFVEFIIDKTGQMTQFKILDGIGAGCDAEALRVLELYPENWAPAKHDGKIVNQKIVLPISFKLGKDTHKKAEKSQ